MMQRFMAFAARTKVFFSNPNKMLLRQSSSFSHGDHDDFKKVMSLLSNAPPYGRGYQLHSDLNALDLTNLLEQHQQYFPLKVIQTSWHTILVEEPVLKPYNLIHFLRWALKKSHLFTTPFLEPLVSSICSPTVPTLVLESLVSAICSTTQYSASFGSSIEYPIHLDEARKDDLLFLWEFLKHIGHNQTGLLNAKILNQLLDFFRFMADKEKAVKVALEVFHKFQVFQCVPNQDTYTLTLQHIFYDNTIRGSTDMLQEATSICQKIILHPETLVPDDDDMLCTMLLWFSENNMVKEARALYLAAIEKWKRNPNWSLRLYNFLSPIVIKSLCSTKETVHLAFEMVTDMPEEGVPIFRALIGFKDFDTAKQLLFQMIANNPQLIGYFDEIIAAYVKANEIGQALEMVILMESMGIPTCYIVSIGLRYDVKSDNVFEREIEDSVNIEGIMKILEEAKRKLDSCNLVIASLYHTSIVQYCKLHNFDEALKLFTEMKDHVISFNNLDEYHKLIHKLIQNRGHREMEKELRIEMHLIFMAYFNRKAKVETIALGYPPEELFASLE